MGTGWEPWPAGQRKSNHVLINLFVAALLIGISFRLLCSLTGSFLPIAESPEATVAAESVAGTKAPPLGVGDAETKKDSLSTNSDASSPKIAPDVEEHVSAQDSMPTNSDAPSPAPDVSDQVSEQEKCDLFTGEWIPSPSGPAYTNRSCRFIEPPQNCMKNGRPDTGYLYWKWKPHGCNVSSFNAERFLETMRNKSWALIGDSILRNHAQSLLCLLSKAEEAVEVYHDEQFKSRRWIFPSHNFTLSLVWSPFLIKAEIFENDDGESKSENRLHIDILDKKWTSQYSNFDYIVISGGQWFLKTAIYLENSTVIGCHYCPKLNLSEHALEKTYSKVLSSIYQFIANSEHKPVVIYRTWTPDHFEYGRWYNGGLCNRTAPYKAGQYNGSDVDHLMRNVELEEFRRALNASENKSRLKLLDTYQLSLLRPDGHSSAYRRFHPFDKDKNAIVQYDCLHWCLPGPVDTWNDLIMELVLNH